MVKEKSKRRIAALFVGISMLGAVLPTIAQELERCRTEYIGCRDTWWKPDSWCEASYTDCKKKAAALEP